jgi:hypothetical protein
MGWGLPTTRIKSKADTTHTMIQTLRHPTHPRPDTDRRTRPTTIEDKNSKIMRRLRVLQVPCWNAKKRRLLHPSTRIISRGVTTKRANSGNARTTTTASATRAATAATTNLNGLAQFRRQPARALSTRNRNRNGPLKLKVLELEAFDRLDSHCDSIDIHTETRKRKQQKPGSTLYIGDDTTKSWKVLAFGKDEDEEQTSSTSSSSDQEPKLKQAASLSLSKSFGNIQQTFHDHVLQHFLPAHFPSSVAPGYARFTAFGFCASGT